MQVSVETVGSIGRRVTVAIPAEQFEKEVGTKLRQLVQGARLPGFRPGKAPLKVVESHYGKDVLNEVAAKLIDSTLREALTQEKLVPAGGPNVEPTRLERGEDLEYVASFDVYPKIKRADIDGVRIERPAYEVRESDIDSTVETMRKQRLSWEPVDRSAELKDRLMIDFVGTVDGEAFPGGSAENFAVILGEMSLLKEFEDGLIGSRAGQQLELEVNFPEDYHGQEVAGKLATFNVTVQEVSEPVYPELDEEFVKSFGVEDGDIGKLRAEVRENVEREMADRVRRILRQRVFDALIEANEFDLPEAMVEVEIDQLIESNKKMLEGQGVPVGNVDPDRGNFRESAEKRVALGLIMQAVVEKHELKPDAGRVRERVEAIGSGYEDPAAFVQWYYSDRQRLAQMEAMIMEEQLVEKMLEGAEIEDKEISFDELMRSAGE